MPEAPPGCSSLPGPLSAASHAYRSGWRELEDQASGCPQRTPLTGLGPAGGLGYLLDPMHSLLPLRQQALELSRGGDLRAKNKQPRGPRPCFPAGASQGFVSCSSLLMASSLPKVRRRSCPHSGYPLPCSPSRAPWTAGELAPAMETDENGDRTFCLILLQPPPWPVPAPVQTWVGPHSLRTPVGSEAGLG